MKLEAHWQRTTWLVCLVWVFSVLFRGIVVIRQTLYRAGVLKSYRSTLPTIVVGNITVGGTGKTPLVIALADYLKSCGYSPGIVSRGHGGALANANTAHLVSQSDSAEDVGDEPLLIAGRTGFPVSICPQRHLAVELLAADTACDVVISDDGLQHYAMQRDLEIVSIDADRGLGNGFMLPAGPLREPVSRLSSIDFVVSKNKSVDFADYFRLDGYTLRSVCGEDRQTTLEDFSGKRVHAVAGIGNPDNFFELLRKNGIKVVEHPFPDHHRYTSQDFMFDEKLPLIMTEKDAVKCGALNLKSAWYLVVEAVFFTDVLQRIEYRLKTVVQQRNRRGDSCAAV